MWDTALPIFLLLTVFVSIDQLHLSSMRRCGNKVFMHRASRMSIEVTTPIDFCFVFSFLVLLFSIYKFDVKQR